MKNESVKRYLALATAAFMAISGAGCGAKDPGDTKKPEADDKKQETVEDETESKFVDPNDPMSAYKEEVRLGIISGISPGMENGLNNYGHSYEDNSLISEVKERFNIKVEFDWLSSDYETKLNLSIADGDLPDVFKVNDQQLEQLVKSDLLMDMKDVFDKYASPEIKGYMEENQDIFETGVFDGKLLGIPSLSYGIIDNFDYVWIRKDWKEELNLPDPETVDELLDIARAFKEHYGATPILNDRDLRPAMKLVPCWGTIPGIWMEQEDGSIEYGSIQPEAKEAMRNFVEWYKEGIFESEFTSCDREAIYQEMITGKAGICIDTQSMLYSVMGPLVDNLGPDAIFEPYIIPTATGERARKGISFKNNAYIVVNKNCKNPEAIMKIINWQDYMSNHSVGKEDPELIDMVTQELGVFMPFIVLNPHIYEEEYKVTQAALHAEKEPALEELGPRGAKYTHCMEWLEWRENPDQEKSAGVSVADWLQQGNDRSAFGIGMQYIEDGIGLKDKMWGKPVPTLLATGSTLDDILKEGFTKIITGAEDIDYFDTVVEQWKKAGGDQATKEINEIYGKQ